MDFSSSSSNSENTNRKESGNSMRNNLLITQRYNELQKSMLAPGDIRDLHWREGGFSFPGLIRIGSIGDGSCLFHSIANSYFKPHQTGKIGDLGFDRIQFVRQFRKDLAEKLGSVDPENPDGKTYYDQLSRGQLAEMSKEVPQYSLQNMTEILNSNLPVGNDFNEFISNQLNLDIYLLEMTRQDVYIQGDPPSFYKGRKSIVLMYLPGHYELVGLRTKKGIVTLFEPDAPLIRALHARVIEKTPSQ